MKTVSDYLFVTVNNGQYTINVDHIVHIDHRLDTWVVTMINGSSFILNQEEKEKLQRTLLR